MIKNSIITRIFLHIVIILFAIGPMLLAASYLRIKIPDYYNYTAFPLLYVSIIASWFIYIPELIKRTYKYFGILQTKEEKELYSLSDDKAMDNTGSFLMAVIIGAASIILGLIYYGLVAKYNVMENLGYFHIMTIILSGLITLVSYKGMTKGMNVLLKKSSRSDTSLKGIVDGWEEEIKD
jgi:hypothetical protein